MSMMKLGFLKNQIGRFYISRSAFVEHTDAIFQIMGKVMVTRCEFLAHRDCFEYFAYSFEFGEVTDDGAEVPIYDVRIKSVSGSEADEVSFVRRDDATALGSVSV